MSNSTHSFHDLPSSVRFRIYSFTGLVRLCPISPCTEGEMKALRKHVLALDIRARERCVYKMKAGGRMRFSKNGIDCYCPELPLQLLRVCRSVYRDTLPLLYGMNKFKVLGHTSSDLRLLRTLSPIAISSMTSLLIRLNCWPCLLGHDDITLRIGSCLLCGTLITPSDARLTNTTQAGRDMLSEWRAVCTYFAEAVRPSLLKLTVICDTTDIAVAKEVMEAVTKLPRLIDCTIRLRASRDDSLASLARETMQAMTGAKIPATPFPFFNLPKELRLRILHSTHLGAHGSYHPRYQSIRIEDNKLRIGHLDFAYRSKCCYRCNDTRDNCCCPTTHASVSASCICRLIPFELFLVSKLMSQEAEEVFFSTNCFEFNQDHSRTLEFLNRMDPHVLKSFRRVRFMFMDNHIRSWESETREQWRELMEFVNQNFNVPNLCLIVNTEANLNMCIDYQGDTGFVYAAYREIAY